MRNRWMQWIGLLGVLMLLLITGSPLAAQGYGGGGSGGGNGGGGGGGHEPGGEEGAGNNLSYPAAYSNNATPDVYEWTIPSEPSEGGVFGVHYVYGCDQPETVDGFSYPNTSCGSLDKPACVSTTDPVGPCSGFEATALSRIYAQQNADNQWSAQSITTNSNSSAYDGNLRKAYYTDWADNLESNTWSDRSTIRVETQPFYDTGYGGPTGGECTSGDAPPQCMKGFQMWHISGHGPSELWGVRTKEEQPDPLLPPVLTPYIYSSPYAIIYTSNARLNLAKLEPGDAACPSPGTGEVGVPPPIVLDWVEDPNEGGMMWVNSEGGDDPCKLRDINYTVELNVGGKWVYGHNWATKYDVLSCDNWKKAGWWRLTFYTTGDPAPVDLTGPHDIQMGPPTLPPASADSSPAISGSLSTVAESETEDTLYTPKIDAEHNLTYIDICLVNKLQGGGGGGNKPW